MLTTVPHSEWLLTVWESVASQSLEVQRSMTNKKMTWQVNLGSVQGWGGSASGFFNSSSSSSSYFSSSSSLVFTRGRESNLSLLHISLSLNQIVATNFMLHTKCKRNQVRERERKKKSKRKRDPLNYANFSCVEVHCAQFGSKLWHATNCCSGN